MEVAPPLSLTLHAMSSAPFLPLTVLQFFEGKKGGAGFRDFEYADLPYAHKTDRPRN